MLISQSLSPGGGAKLRAMRPRKGVVPPCGWGPFVERIEGRGRESFLKYGRLHRSFFLLSLQNFPTFPSVPEPHSPLTPMPSPTSSTGSRGTSTSPKGKRGSSPNFCPRKRVTRASSRLLSQSLPLPESTDSSEYFRASTPVREDSGSEPADTSCATLYYSSGDLPESPSFSTTLTTTEVTITTQDMLPDVDELLRLVEAQQDEDWIPDEEEMEKENRTPRTRKRKS